MNFKDGVLMTLNVGKWGGAKKLTPEDLNLNESDIPQFMHLGRKMLIPEDEKNIFTQIENNARKFLERYSFAFPVGAARFVPLKALIFVDTELQKYQHAFNTAAQSFLDRYDSIREEMLTAYPAYRERLEPYYPAQEHIKGRFIFGWNVFEIKEASIGDKQSIPEYVAASQAAFEKFKTNLEEQFNGFLGEVVTEMRQNIIECCNGLAERIKAGEVVKAQSLQAIKSMMDRFSMMNFVGDTAIEEKLNEMRGFMNGNSPKDLAHDLKQPENEELKKQLGDLAAGIAAEAANIPNDISAITGGYKRKLDLT